ncbi:MAG: hypothetical protein II011_01490 [Prevotella sp.]|nr:hypothetical protein [Prevotella sp.]MBQ1799405.1 hypothetical protein [Prevotella sp.]
MNKSDMVESLINHYCDGNKAKFALLLGLKPQTINGWIARETFDSELIYSKCKGVSAKWLLSSGEGEMLEHSQNVNTSYSINEEIIRLRAENDVLREVIGLFKKNDVMRNKNAV